VTTKNFVRKFRKFLPFGGGAAYSGLRRQWS